MRARMCACKGARVQYLNVPAAERVDGEDREDVARESKQGDVERAERSVVGTLAETHGLGDSAVEERVAVEEDVEKEPRDGGTNERPPEGLEWRNWGGKTAKCVSAISFRHSTRFLPMSKSW